MLHLKYAETNLRQSKLFILDRPEGIEFYDLVFFKTKTQITVGKQMTTIGKYYMIIYNKFSKQHYYTAEDYLMSDFLHFDVDSKSEKKIFSNLVFDKPFLIEQPECIERLMQLIEFEYSNKHPHHEGNSSQLLSILLKKAEEALSLSTQKETFKNSDEILKIKSLIMENPHKSWNVKDLAHRCDLSESHFQIAYKKLFGTNCITDVINARLEMAKVILKNSNLSIAEVSLRCGYNNLEHFSRQFKKAYGVSPLKYRKGF